MDGTSCPLCGEANHCVMATGKPDPEHPCWCKAKSFPHQLLEMVPAAAKNRCCICNSCLESFQQKTGG
ncbi:MAG: hypothetical protein CO187_05390 [Zetaproteobacteria bacterium CG_4_9_14_3_um_filter_53_7]|nr:MAG: hypothetical protein CO187_05390 [Zetaproteobacteria bacterium CG_4_9_14_3_um_filter_53_7]